MAGRSNPRDILCFQHCDRHINILCFAVPEVCPICRRLTNETPCRIPPYVIPSPFKHAWRNPCSVVIRPTFGTFLNFHLCKLHMSDYLVHFLETFFPGAVFDYDEDGVNIGSPTWDQECIVVDLRNEGLNQDMMRHWDQYLIYMSKSGIWTPLRYDTDRHNCYDFVLTFLKQVGLNFENWASHSKFSFTQNLVLPHTAKAGKYITLYRNILKDGYFCQTSPQLPGGM
ncbi:hypothetical protein FSP39_012703 [Pinctada imbricata]|uniref:MKRN2 opposite strand protein n=1 Tax=Pinctada imbricata TaxID=66713 RepID=A0AA88Y2D3_PINIB|nr:hypothetical protein FSP39_012703 [Pinctada imbricata]